MNKWDSRFMELADTVAGWSKDTGHKCGAVIIREDTMDIIAIGYNGLPRGMDDSVSRYTDKPEKYFFTEHAERNAIYNAARKGSLTNDYTMYVSWFPCADCARAIVQAGIKRIVCRQPVSSNPIWVESFRHANHILLSCNVEVCFVE